MKTGLAKEGVCNGLLATVGLRQVHADGSSERPFLTLGEDLSFLDALLGPTKLSYTVDELITYLTDGLTMQASGQ